MGLLRKMTSLSTLGLVHYYNDGEASRRLARQTRNATRTMVVQNQMMLHVQRNQLEAQIQGNGYQMARDAMPMRQGPPSLPPGWYADPTDRRALCWWDGMAWLPATKRYPQGELPS